MSFIAVNTISDLMSIPTTHEAVGEQHHLNVVRPAADEEEDGRHEAADDRHNSTSKLVGERSNDWTCNRSRVFMNSTSSISCICFT